MISHRTIHTVQKVLRWKKPAGDKMMALGTIHILGLKGIKMEEVASWEDDVTQSTIYTIGSKYSKMEEAARWEDVSR